MKRVYSASAALCALVLAATAGSALAQTQTTMIIKDGNGNLQNVCNVQIGSGGPLAPCQAPTVNGALVSSTNPLPVGQPDATNQAALALGTLNSAYTVSLANGEGTVGFNALNLTGTGAVLTFEAQNNGSAWFPINSVVPGTGTLSQTINTDGNYRINAAGHTAVRLRVSTAAGTASNATISSTASSVSGLTALSAPIPTGANQIGLLASPANLPTGQASMSTTAAQIVAARTGRETVTVENLTGTAVYIGSTSGVTSTTGILLPGTIGASLTISYTGALYGVTASGTSTVAEYETY